jgi:hypothetical protein
MGRLAVDDPSRGDFGLDTVFAAGKFVLRTNSAEQ